LVEPRILFEHYLYTPSASATWREHCEELAGWLELQAPGAQPFVVEPASNDGCLLKAIARWAPRVLGVEPARNIAEQANRDGIPTIAEFFGEASARRVRAEYGPADIVIGTNVLAHVPDMIDFLRGAAALMGDEAMIVVEAPYLRDLVEKTAFDTIYHEHVSYLSVTALDYAYRLAGLVLTHVEPTPTHGGSIRFVGRHLGASPDASVGEYLKEERANGYADGSAMLDFATKVDHLRERLRNLVDQEVARGMSLAAYGATAKGNTLLSTSGIQPGLIQFIVDRNPLKQGLVTPGTRIPVVPPAHLEQHPVDILLVLAWNIADEIMSEQHWFADQGGQFLIPVPDPKVVGRMDRQVAPADL
jgi:hypothetical protein